MNNNKSNSKKDMAVAGFIAFGAAIIGSATQSGISSIIKKSKEKPTLIDKYNEGKRLMYLKGQTIYSNYTHKKERIQQSAMINAKVEENNKHAASE